MLPLAVLLLQLPWGLLQLLHRMMLQQRLAAADPVVIAVAAAAAASAAPLGAGLQLG
jgi:hypothetical protein